MATLMLAAAASTLFAVAILWPGPAAPEPLLVADLRGHALVVLDPSQPQHARRIPLPGGPHELLRLPDGRVVASLEQYGALAVVDVPRASVEVVEVGGVPHGLALMEVEGRTVLLVTDRSADTVRRFALDGWSELPPLAARAWPHAVAVLPSGEVSSGEVPSGEVPSGEVPSGEVPSGEVVVASARAGTLSIGARVHQAGALAESVAVAVDGRVAVAAAQDGWVTVYSPAGETLARYEVGGRPVRVLFSPDGRTLAVALSAAGAVALIEDGEGVEDGAGVRVTRVRVSGVPDGLVYASDGEVLYASDVHGGAVTAIARDGRVLAAIPVGQAPGAMLAWGR